LRYRNTDDLIDDVDNDVDVDDDDNNNINNINKD